MSTSLSSVGAALDGILWILGGIAGACFLIGYGAAYVPPETFWWMEPFAVLLPSLSVILAVGAVASWAATPRSRARAAVAVVVLGLVTVRFGPSLDPGASSVAAADTSGVLRLMTFNAPFVGGDPNQLAAGVARAVEQEDPHVVALQEPKVFSERLRKRRSERTSPQLHTLLDASPYHLPAVLPETETVRLPVLARSRIDTLTHYRLDASSDPYASRVGFRWKGRRAVLYNVHLHTTVGPQKPWTSSRFRYFDWAFWTPVLDTYRTGAHRRAEQARHLRRMIEQETAPVLVVGDFNSTPHHWVYRHIAEGLTDAHDVGGDGFGWTYPADRPLVRIDHVLVSDAWAVVSTHVSSQPTPSDHRPVVARLQWRREAE